MNDATLRGFRMLHEETKQIPQSPLYYHVVGTWQAGSRNIDGKDIGGMPCPLGGSWDREQAERIMSQPPESLPGIMDVHIEEDCDS